MSVLEEWNWPKSQVKGSKAMNMKFSHHLLGLNFNVQPFANVASQEQDFPDGRARGRTIADSVVCDFLGDPLTIKGVLAKGIDNLPTEALVAIDGVREI